MINALNIIKKYYVIITVFKNVYKIRWTHIAVWNLCRITSTCFSCKRNLSHFESALTEALARLSFNRAINGTRWTALTRHWRLTDMRARREPLINCHSNSTRRPTVSINIPCFPRVPSNLVQSGYTAGIYSISAETSHPLSCHQSPQQLPPSLHIHTLLLSLSLFLYLRTDIEPINKARDGCTRELHELLIPRWTYMSGES